MTTAVLVLNCGSSSVKFALVDPDSGDRLLSGLAERVGQQAASISIRYQEGARELEPPAQTDHHGVLAVVLQELSEWARSHGIDVVAVGHRIVHGGEEFASSVVLDDASMAAVRACVPLAPLHNPANIAGVEAAQALLPDVPHVGVFDTAFHQSMPPVAYRYAVPQEWYDDLGVRRYGFHGTSHLYVSQEAARMLGRAADDPQLRIITAHLGNGCSATAIKGGRSVDTSMGLTPLEGLVMGTRSGDLDPGILGYLADRTGADVHALVDDLNKRSGLLGLSGVSNDMRELTAAAHAGDERAQLAFDIFVYRLAKYIASLVVPLGGLDALVFTGGIGENGADVRAQIVELLGFLGLRLDAEANDATIRGRGGRITTGEPGQGPVALVVPTDEEFVIARDAHALTAAS